jgi:hypothetical protein
VDLFNGLEKEVANWEYPSSTLASFLFAQEDYDAARKYYSFALAANPSSIYHGLHVALADFGLGRKLEYETTLLELYNSQKGGSHELLPELTCRASFVMRKRGDTQEADALATAACGMGSQECCADREKE